MTLKICKWLFLLLIVSLPLVRPFNTVIFGLLVPYTDFIFLAVAALWLFAVLRRETRLEFSNFYVFIGFYGLALVISTIFSIHPQKSFYKLIGEFYLFGLAVITFNLARDAEFFRRIIYAWLIGTALTVLAALAGFALFYLGCKTVADNYFLSHFGSLPAGNYPRIHALFANANMMTNFLNIGFLLALLAEKAGWLRRIFARILQAGILFAAFFTFSPGVGGIILSAGIWLRALLKAEKKSFIANFALISAIAGALLVFGATLISPDTQNTTRDLNVPVVEKRIEPSVRVLVWENALQKFKEFPLFGRGTGADAALLRYQTLAGSNQTLLDAHNVWLNVLGQIGLFGCAAFSALSVYLISCCRLDFEELNERNLAQLALSCALIGTFLYQGLSGSFEDARHLWVLFGMLVAVSTFSKNDISAASQAPAHRLSI